jgi:hypothetical protein
MLEIATVIVESFAELTDRMLMELRARKILARWPKHEVIELFLSFDSSSFLAQRAARMKKIAQMQAEGWIYLGSDSSKSTQSLEGGETMRFLRSLDGKE